MSELETLYRIQELDTEIFTLHNRDENHSLKGELEELEENKKAMQEEMEATASSLEEVRKKQAGLEVEIERLDEKLSREEEKLYGGTVGSPKELRGLQAEIRSLKHKKDGLETEMLEEMERQDEIKKGSDELQAGLDRLQAEIDEKRGVLESEMSEIHAQLAEVEKQQEELRTQVDEELLELYERLLESKHHVAVAKVIDGVCQGCRVELPGKEYDRFLKSDNIFRCSNCGRILVK